MGVGNGKGFKLLRMVKKEQHESVGKKLENKMKLKEASNIKKSLSALTILTEYQIKIWIVIVRVR